MTKSFCSIVVLFGFLSSVTWAQADKTTVSFTLDHNRIILPVEVYCANGNHITVNAWLDNGNPILSVTERLLKETGLLIIADSSESRIAKTAAARIRIGGMPLSIGDLPIEVETSRTVGSGLNAEITLPATLLKQFDVIVDYPAGKLTIGNAGAVKFEGTPIQAYIHPENALIQIPSSLGADSFHIALDLGTPVSLVSGDLVSKWSKANPAWSSIGGAIGVANLWGMDIETKWGLLRVHHLLFGRVDLPDLVAVTCPPEWLDYFIKRVGIPTAGLIGAEALKRFSIGIDYAHNTIYLRKSEIPPKSGFDLIGLTLRPEANGRYSVLGVTRYNGKPVVKGVNKGDTLISVNNHPVTGLTMGQVWSQLSGSPGATYALELKRAGKTVRIKTKVRHFLN